MTFGEAPYFILVQDPEVKGMVGGQPFTYGDIRGDRYFEAGENGAPDRIEICWSEKGMTYYLFAELSGLLDEQTVLAVANSVSIE